MTGKIDAHAQRWKHDSDFADRIRGELWEPIVRFYAALHITSAYLCSKNERFQAKRHNERWEAIKSAPELRHNFRTSFKRLQDMSEQVRYEAEFRPRPEDYEASRRDLTVVVSFIRGKIPLPP